MVNIRSHVDRAYEHVFKSFDETAIYNPDDENIEIKVFPYTLDKETDVAETRFHEKFFMVRECELANPKDGDIIRYLGEDWIISEVEREDVAHFKLRCRNKSRLVF